ncbi:FAD-dependent oxidoreductase [Cellulomonas sp. DKR-3]|uniref:FAD-dependent oxidoreductase n=1 Tax=Cellulomonas fulva TaxID=2835530 RepID=A0ABS5TXF6_9CELL|nr:FAD-dependent oxidoreductase [Cellulomonas fulva]MBT0993811.1 FAD-dependent oxidoreductase [Cellulomonas fulva]
MSGPRHHDVLVVGGGNAGISLAAKLRRDGCRNVAVVEPRTTHHYRPLLSYVASGMATLDDLRRPEGDVVPDGVRWYIDEVAAVDPQASHVRLASGEVLHCTDLAVCPGSQVDWDAVPGAQAAMATPAAATSYLPELATKTWTLLSSLTSGTAVFAVSDRHVPCSPVALKPLLTAADHWRRTGLLDAIDVHLVHEGAALVGEARADRELRAAAERFGVRVRMRTAVESVDPEAQTLRLSGPDGSDELRYDAFYLAPPHRAPAWIAESGLATAASDGFVAVDPHTLQHTEHPAIWGLGDAADVQTPPSGGALRKQVPVVAHNIAARRTGAPMNRYQGYTVAPVTTDRRRLLLGEFDRDGTPEPTFRFPDLVRPRRTLLAFDRYLEPPIYWHRLLKGKVS